MPMETAVKLLASEAATIRYLKAHSDIPVPEIYDYCASFDNGIGIPFILMSEAPGQPLSSFWKSNSSSQSGLDDTGKAKILSQLGSVTWRLSQLRFDKIGSLFEEDESFVVKECLSRGHMLHQRYCLKIPRGPFLSEADFYDSLISAFSEHAEIMPLSHHCFVAPIPSQNDYQDRTQYTRAVDLWSDFVTVGNKIDTADNRLDYIIRGDILHDIVQKLKFPVANQETYPISHSDLSVNNIYVDDDHNITCIIDWAFTSALPESFLLAAPGLPQYGDEISSELHRSFKTGFLAALPGTMEENLVQKYHESLEWGHLSWKLSRLLNLDSTSDYPLFATIWSSTYGAKQDLGEYFLQQRRSDRYVQRYKEVQEQDQPLSKIKQDECSYFRDNDFRSTIAKKLTVMSEWNAQYGIHQPSKIREGMFIAYPKLWKWIQQFMQDLEDICYLPPSRQYHTAAAAI
ncbi:hypothetical protein N7528_001169 [Penicillium herquei]|nr:hypothetical protein N7528_001169 [Penicillium herquei]